MDRPRHLWTTLKRFLGFVGRVVAAFLRNRGILLAGGVGYNALLSLVPFLTLTVATLSLFFDEQRILGILRPQLRVMVPQHADAILQNVQAFFRNQVTLSVVSIVVLLFFSSLAFRMLEEAVAGIFHVSGATARRRRFWVSALLPYLFIVLLVIGLFVTTLLTSGLDAMGGHSVRLLGVERSLAPTARLLLRLVGFVGLVIAFSGIYRVVPVIRVSLRRALIGGLCAAGLWRLVGLFMVYYFTKISMVNLIYGSLATVIVVLLFLEAAFVILLFGAQVIAELEASATAGLRWFEKPNLRR
jgi:YihY family inner membrane protein